MIWEREHTVMLFTAVGGVFLSICTFGMGIRTGKTRVKPRFIEKRVEVPVEKIVVKREVQIRERRTLPAATVPITRAGHWQYNLRGLWIGDFTITSKATFFDEKWEHEIKLNARNTTAAKLPVNVMAVLYQKDGEPVAATCIRNVEIGRTNELEAREARTLKGEFILAPKHLAAVTHILLEVVRP